MKRREFLKILGIGGAGTGLGFVFGKVTQTPGAKLIPYLVPPEEIVPGVANWYASLCAECNSGCGIIVRVMEGRAKKIEGNPGHPVSKGGLCVRGQASVQRLYNPDRIKGPLKRRGQRGSGDYAEVTWDEASAELAKNLSDLRKSGEAGKFHLLTSQLHGHLNQLAASFMSGYGSPNHIQYELFQNRNLLYANQASMGLNTIPHYNIEHTKYLLSFGADFGSTWLSPVNFSKGYGRMRQGEGARGKLVQVEPRISVTGANADEWVPARPGTEAILALGIAHAMVEKGYNRAGDASAWRAALSAYRPKEVAAITDVKEERIYEIAKEFAQTRPSLAIGGEGLSSYENGVSGLVAVNILNHLAGNLGVKGGVLPNPDDPLRAVVDMNKRITALASAAASSKVKALAIYNTNPVFTTPKPAKLEESLKDIPFIVSFSSFMDETTALADLILPANTPLEDWGDGFAEPAAGAPVYTIMQPAVSPVFDTKPLGDILLALAKSMPGNMGPKLQAQSFADYVRNGWKELYSRNKAMAAGTADFDDFWDKTLQNGGWWSQEPSRRGLSVSAGAASANISNKPARFDGDEKQFPLYLITYAHPMRLDGRGANLPWLQEIPDPMTSVVWGSWVEINPKTAESLGIKEGDTVSIESPSGRISAHAYLFPGIRPDTVAIPLGQGHVYGRYAKDRGENPAEVLPLVENPKTGALALNSTRVKVSVASPTGRMVKMEGSTKELGRGIVKTVSPEEFSKMKKEA